MASRAAPPPASTEDIVFDPFVTARIYDFAREDGLNEGYEIEKSRGAAIGDVVRVVLRGPRNGIPASKSIILKKPPPDEKATNFSSIALFSAEVRAYEHLLKMFVRFQRDKAVPTTEGFYNISKCYSIACNAETQRYLLIMEDLLENGYTMMDRLAPVTIAHARLVARELGRFHGVSLAISDQRPDLFEPYAQHENLLLADLERKPSIRQFFENSLRGAIDLLDDERDEHLKLKLETAAQNFMQHMRRCLHSKLDEPMRVIGHGNLWTSNIMFQHVSSVKSNPEPSLINFRLQVDGQPTRVCLIDYKNICLISPVLDIINYLFIGTNKHFRDNYAEEVLREYHDALSKIVRKLGSDPDRLFSWQTFEKELIKFGIFNVLVAPFQLQVSMADAEDLRRYQDAVCSGGDSVPTDVFGSVFPHALYKQTLLDVLRDADDWEFFPKS